MKHILRKCRDGLIAPVCSRLDEQKLQHEQMMRMISGLTFETGGAMIRGAYRFLKDMGYPPVFSERNNLALLSHGDTRTSYFDAFAKAGYAPYVLENNSLFSFDQTTLIEELSCDYIFLHHTNPLFRDRIAGKYEPKCSEREVIEAVLSHDINDIEYVLGQTANLRGSKYVEYPGVKEWNEKVKEYYRKSDDPHVAFLYKGI